LNIARDCASDAANKRISQQSFQLSDNKLAVADERFSPSTAYHVGDSFDTDVKGAFKAGWTPMRFREWFDEDFPDWTVVDTDDTVVEAAKERAKYLYFGRRDKKLNIDWVELWGLDDVLHLFGFPPDMERPLATNYMKGAGDE
jgi:hypothetical protein